jgi:pimeloyl-ACP methyl ester carboxylesterase
MPFITANDGTQLYWREWGEGAPLLFLNGLGAGSAMWDYQMAFFGERGFRCIGFDRRGHGRSDHPARGYDHDSFADDIAVLIETLKLDRVTLVTHSMAGGEAVRYLSRHGDRHIARLAMLAPLTPKLLRTPDNPHGIPRADFEALWDLWRRDYPRWVDDATAPFFVPETSRPMMRWGASLLQVSVPVALACSRAMADEDFRDELRQLRLPVLIIHGDRDRSAPLEITGRPTAALLPDCRLEVYEGAPHGLMFTHMDRLHADLLRFIEAR